MVVCLDCGQEMLDAESCTLKTLEISGEVYSRDTEYYDTNFRCHDCKIANRPGNIHHLGCDIERCPCCGGQIISCDCSISALDNWFRLRR